MEFLESCFSAGMSVLRPAASDAACALFGWIATEFACSEAYRSYLSRWLTDMAENAHG
jgi:hypothetical protein